MGVDIFYSKDGTEYNKFPVGIERKPFCVVWEKLYRKNFMSSMKEVSNLPQYADDEESCPVKKVFLIELFPFYR